MNNQTTNIRVELVKQDKAQKDLADLLGMTHQAVSKRMKRATPFDADELSAIAAYLGVPVDRLSGERVAS